MRYGLPRILRIVYTNLVARLSPKGETSMASNKPSFIDDPFYGRFPVTELTPENLQELHNTARGYADETLRSAQAAEAACALTTDPLARACANAAMLESRVAHLCLETYEAVRDADRDRVGKLIGDSREAVEQAMQLLDSVELDLRVGDKHLRKAREKAGTVCAWAWEDSLRALERHLRTSDRLSEGVPAADLFFSVRDCEVGAQVCLEAILALASPQDKGYEKGLLKNLPRVPPTVRELLRRQGRKV